MIKLLLCVFSGMALAMMILQLRQQHLELSYKINHLHREIESHQAPLWRPRVIVLGEGNRVINEHGL